MQQGFIALVCRTVFILFLTLSITACEEYAATPAQRITRGIEQILTRFGDDINIGIKVQRMRDGSTLYEQHSTRLFIPASTLKLYTVAAALQYLGYNYRFPTQILASWSRKSHLLANVYLKFSGDPSLREEDLRDLFKDLVHQGVSQINGNIYIDSSSYEAPSLGRGWMWDDAPFCFSATVWAANINHNCQAKTVSTIPRTFALRTAHLSMMNLPYYLTRQIRQALRSSGIVWHGKIKQGVTPQGMILMASHYSPPLWRLITHMLKVSDNLYAESVFKRTGMAYLHRKASWSAGVRTMQDMLDDKVSTTSLQRKIIDGSGLSRCNLVSPALSSAVLREMYMNVPLFKTIMPNVFAPYPSAWLNQLLVSSDRVKAKTGSMSGVVGLTGFAQNARLGDLSFVLLVNGFKGNLARHRLLLARIATFLTYA